MVVLNCDKKKESPNDDYRELGRRARVAFAATVDNTENFEFGSNYEEEGSSNKGLHKYVEKAINEVNKTKSNYSHASKGKSN